MVFDDLQEKDSTICPHNNTIFVTGEPESVKKYDKKFLKQFGTVVTAQEHISHPHVINTHQILPWYVHKTYDELVAMSPPEKECLLSIVTSNKRFSKGHEQRYQFAMALKEYFGDRSIFLEEAFAGSKINGMFLRLISILLLLKTPALLIMLRRSWLKLF